MEGLQPISPVVIEGMILASLVQWRASSQFAAGEGMSLASLVQWKASSQFTAGEGMILASLAQWKASSRLHRW